MEITIEKDKITEIKISIGFSSEKMLVPEARRLRDKLDEAIKKAEAMNRPPVRRFGDH